MRAGGALCPTYHNAKLSINDVNAIGIFIESLEFGNFPIQISLSIFT